MTVFESPHVLPDVLAPGLRIVFCGSAAGAESARRGAYYAGRGNKFWPVLSRVGLTSRQFAPHEFQEVLSEGIGLTDIAKSAHGSDLALRGKDYDAAAVRRKIEHYAPRFLAFNGKNAACRFLGRSVTFGEQKERIGETRLFVLPSTSGAANGYWDESVWQAFADEARTA